ncbi:hypothetical protein KIN20_011127 [Parelaphostrongylus tenuis]|uniref:Uncharacterized protein n=1 Tax=Parelaphostrongylus tenuis TaxID=148309 RepID=A0AAD5QJC1_PARTN|nr:hypothetical protein KIN20_011127 [Parelaphostrongylus tenuis]
MRSFEMQLYTRVNLLTTVEISGVPCSSRCKFRSISALLHAVRLLKLNKPLSLVYEIEVTKEAIEGEHDNSAAREIWRIVERKLH